MEVFLAIAVLAVGIATLVVVLSFRKRTEKQVSAMLDRFRDTSATKNEKAINDLRAQLHEALARLDQLRASLLVEPEASSQVPVLPAHEAGSTADGSSPDP